MYNCCMDSMHPQIHPQLPAMFPGLCCPQRRTKEVQGLLSSRTELNGCYWESWGMTCHATLMSKAEGKVARVWKGFNITSWFGRRFRISVLQWRAGKTWGVMVIPKHLPPPSPRHTSINTGIRGAYIQIWPRYTLQMLAFCTSSHVWRRGPARLQNFALSSVTWSFFDKDSDVFDDPWCAGEYEQYIWPKQQPA